MKKLIPAIVLLLISAMIMATASYAWFSMNTQVTATGMQVKATAEEGLLIINETVDDVATNWQVSATASYNTAVALAPTSTSNVAAWYHNKSEDPTKAEAGQATASYDTLSGDKWKREATTGAYYFDTNANNTKDAAEKYYVLLNNFFIKSSGDTIDPTTLYINKVKVTDSDTSATSANLNKALRVAIKVGGQVYIYAPIDGATTEYKVAGATSNTTAITVAETTGIANTATAQTSIPAITTARASTVKAEIYIYFEGEDANCKSEYITETLDTLQVEVVFGITTVS